MHILLTGGSGDLGQLLAAQLIERGDQVSSLDVRPAAAAAGIYIPGSILDRPLLERSLRGVDCVVHIAAWHGIHEFTGQKTVDDFWELNVTGTFNVFEAAARAGVGRVVFISSTSVDEPNSLYGHTKVLGEEIARTYSARHGMHVVTLRPRAFIPPWNREVYASFVDWARWFWPGAVHISDVAQAVLRSIDALMSASPPDYWALPLDGAYDYTEADLADWDSAGPGSTFQRHYPGYADLVRRHGLDPSVRPRRLDISETARRLGYRPTYGLRQLLEELAQIDAV
jgi:nucleoside-diphosphate-sugar epimerase